MTQNTVHILYIETKFHLPYAQSLKDKRQIVKGIKDHLSHSFNLSIAEIGHLQEWQLAILGMTMIGIDKSGLMKQSSLIEKSIVERLDGELVEFQLEWL